MVTYIESQGVAIPVFMVFRQASGMSLSLVVLKGPITRPAKGDPESHATGS
jgi:hypothetical protein